MNFSWFANILAVVLTSCCFWSAVSSGEVEQVNPISKGNSLSVLKKLGQRNNFAHWRENSENVRCPAKKKLNPNPTIKPFHPFDSNADAKSLYKAMKGGGTDEQTIIDILTHRTYEQRNEIADVFYQKYGYNFREWLSDEIGGVCGVIINALIYQPTQVLADHLLWAMKGSATHEQTLIDILVAMNPTEKNQVKSLFKKKSGDTLRSYVEDDAADEGELYDMLVALIDTDRPDDDCVDLAQAKEDAATMRHNFQEMDENDDKYKECEGCCCLRGGQDKYLIKCQVFCVVKHQPLASAVHHILASRSWVQLKETFKIYKKEYSVDFHADVYSTWDYYKKTVWAIYQYAMDANTFFAQALERDVHKFEGGTSWGYTYGVARVFTWRSEIDLGDIAQTFEKKYSKTLLGHVEKNIEGDAKEALIGILQ